MVEILHKKKKKLNHNLHNSYTKYFVDYPSRQMFKVLVYTTTKNWTYKISEMKKYAFVHN
jgi:hypothetical protein